jgi:hypothetical protein
MITSAADPESARRGRIVLGTFALADNEISPALLDRYHAARARRHALRPARPDGAVAGMSRGNAGLPSSSGSVRTFELPAAGRPAH